MLLHVLKIHFLGKVETMGGPIEIRLDYESLAPSMAKTVNGLNLVTHY